MKDKVIMFLEETYDEDELVNVVYSYMGDPTEENEEIYNDVMALNDVIEDVRTAIELQCLNMLSVNHQEYESATGEDIYATVEEVFPLLKNN